MTTQQETQPENDAGDQYDRRVDWVGGRPSARNAGWYSSYLPQQRYAAYQTNYWLVLQKLDEGDLAGIPDEALMLLAWAPFDTEAIEAAEEMISSGENPGLEYVHELVFGNSFFRDGVYDDLKMPQINADNPGNYALNVDDLLVRSGSRRSAQDWYSKTPMVQDLVEMLAGEIVNAPRDLLSRAEDADILGGDRPSRANDEPITIGDGHGPSESDLFRYSSEMGHGPGEDSTYQFMQNAENVLVPLGIDMYAAAGAFKAAGTLIGGVMATLGESTMEIAGPTAATTGMSWILRGLAAAGRGTQRLFSTRRRATAIQAVGAVAGVTTSASVAYFGDSPLNYPAAMSDADREVMSQLFGSQQPAQTIWTQEKHLARDTYMGATGDEELGDPTSVDGSDSRMSR